VVSKMDLNVGTEEMYAWSPVRSSVRSFYKLYEVLFVRSTNSTTFCSFVLQTLRRSVRSFYKLYDALFACSEKMNICSIRLIFNRTWLWPVRSTHVRLFFELMAQASVLLGRTLYT